MKDDINLLGTHEKKPEKKRNYFLVISAGFFGCIFVVSLLVLIVSFVEKGKVSNLNTQINNLQGRMNSLAIEKAKILTVSDRLGAIKKIINTRKPMDAKMLAIISFVPPGFNITNFSASDIKISITMTSPSLSDFDDFLEVKIPQLTKNKALGINHIDMSGFSTDPAGYAMTATFYFTPDTK